MRLFTGLALTPEVIEAVSSLVDPLKEQPGMRWSPPENLHITTKFLGEPPEDRLAEVIAALERVPRRDSFSLEVARLDCFPSSKDPLVLYASVFEPGQLTQLSNDTAEVLEQIGIPREIRTYQPHLTLARIDPKGPAMEPIRTFLQQHSTVSFGTVAVSQFHLYRSRPGPHGSMYEILASFELDSPKRVN